MYCCLDKATNKPFSDMKTLIFTLLSCKYKGSLCICKKIIKKLKYEGTGGEEHFEVD